MAESAPDISTRRDHWLPKVRASREELAAIEVRRADAGVSLSEFIRRQALDGAILQRIPMADKELVRALAAVGNNLNQIARSVNIHGDLDRITTAKLRDSLDSIDGLIRDR